MLAAVLGDDVSYAVGAGAFSAKRGIFRRAPIEVAGEGGGAVLITAPTLRVSLAEIPGIATGDRVQCPAAPGETFQVLNVWPTLNPALDRFVICELENITP